MGVLNARGFLFAPDFHERRIIMTEPVRPWLYLARLPKWQDEATSAVLRIYHSLACKEAGRFCSHISYDEALAAAEEGLYHGIGAYDLSRPLLHPRDLSYHFTKYARGAIRNAWKRYQYYYRNIDQTIRDGDSLTDLPETRSTAPAAEDVVLSRTLSPELEMALRRLSERDRDILYRYALEKRPFREIAEQLGISRQAVCKRYQTIKKTLQTYLQGGNQTC